MGFASQGFPVGVEEELLLVEPGTHRLRHDAPAVLGRVAGLKADLYLALVESVSPPCPDAGAAVASLGATRARARAAGAVLMGAGIHPDGPFGEAPHVDDPRYRAVAAQLAGLARRTPTCALHVHVGMPDAETALRAFNGLREHLPLLQALSANSPFWHGRDSLMASARARLFRAYPRAQVPPAFSCWEEHEENVAAVLRAGELPDYTFLWWDLRLHPRLGTVEVRAMDAQAPLRDVLALAALVRALARRAAEAAPVAPSPRAALEESSFRAARDGLGARLWHAGALRAVPEVARAVLDGLEGEGLDEVGRLLAEGNGAERQRAAHARGGMGALLAWLVERTAAAAQ